MRRARHAADMLQKVVHTRWTSRQKVLGENYIFVQVVQLLVVATRHAASSYVRTVLLKDSLEIKMNIRYAEYFNILPTADSCRRIFLVQWSVKGLLTR